MLSGEEAQKQAEIIRAERKRAEMQSSRMQSFNIINHVSTESDPSKKLENLKINSVKTKNSNEESLGQDYIQSRVNNRMKEVQPQKSTVGPSHEVQYYNGVANKVTPSPPPSQFIYKQNESSKVRSESYIPSVLDHGRDVAIALFNSNHDPARDHPSNIGQNLLIQLENESCRKSTSAF